MADFKGTKTGKSKRIGRLPKAPYSVRKGPTIANMVGPSFASATKGTPLAPVGGPGTQLPLTRKANRALRKMGIKRGGDK